MNEIARLYSFIVALKFVADCVGNFVPRYIFTNNFITFGSLTRYTITSSVLLVTFALYINDVSTNSAEPRVKCIFMSFH